MKLKTEGSPIMTYECSHCHGTFETTEERDREARAEADLRWGKDYALAIVCDDCHKEFMRWMANHHPGVMPS